VNKRTWRRLGAPIMGLALLAATTEVEGAEGPDGRRGVPRISVAELKKGLDAGEMIAVDVRSVKAFRAGHIPGAVSVAAKGPRHYVEELKASGKTIVTYCA